MAVKKITYPLILIILCIINIIFYRQIFIEQWMRFKLRDEYIVISLTTTPHRISEIEPTLNTVLKQNVNIKKVYLNIPYKFKRDNLEYKIPKWLVDNKQVTIIRTTDYGPATKLLGTLKHAKLPTNAIIITVDDDVYYPKNLALQLAYKSKLNPNYAIGILGAFPEYDANGIIVRDSDLGLIKTSTADTFVSILQGYTGVAYRRNFFDETIFDIVNYPQDCINSDDLYISFYLAKNNIPRQVLNNKYISPCVIQWQTEIGINSNALHKLSIKPADKHRACIAYMKNKSPQVVF